jgi:hypothetical protein
MADVRCARHEARHALDAKPLAHRRKPNRHRP